MWIRGPVANSWLQISPFSLENEAWKLKLSPSQIQNEHSTFSTLPTQKREEIGATNYSHPHPLPKFSEEKNLRATPLRTPESGPLHRCVARSRPETPLGARLRVSPLALVAQTTSDPARQSRPLTDPQADSLLLDSPPLYPPLPQVAPSRSGRAQPSPPWLGDQLKAPGAGGVFLRPQIPLWLVPFVLCRFPTIVPGRVTTQSPFSPSNIGPFPQQTSTIGKPTTHLSLKTPSV
ncbi:uncharacterized protein LOC142874776 [Microcebus murinus]|uniref:uncharacterized protein LOC142874776 n=1 Tax=Microcebus murinus TaxID=30608 RepID=UPI003F6C5BFC